MDNTPEKKKKPKIFTFSDKDLQRAGFFIKRDNKEKKIKENDNRDSNGK